MTAKTKWDPLKELMTVQKRMNQLFESALARTDFGTQDEFDTWTPVADAYETRDAVVLCLELPGLEQDGIDLRLEGDELVVSGERKMDRGAEGEHFHRIERSYGKFSRRFRVPSTVAREAVRASYRDGVLRVTLPNGEPRRDDPVRVTIQ
jgi:HSP20 family protein